MNKVLSRMKKEINSRLDKLLETKLSDKNLFKAINSYVLPVAGYVMNVCKISETDLKDLDMIVKRKLRKIVDVLPFFLTLYALSCVL